MLRLWEERALGMSMPSPLTCACMWTAVPSRTRVLLMQVTNEADGVQLCVTWLLRSCGLTLMLCRAVHNTEADLSDRLWQHFTSLAHLGESALDVGCCSNERRHAEFIIGTLHVCV